MTSMEAFEKEKESVTIIRHCRNKVVFVAIFPIVLRVLDETTDYHASIILFTFLCMRGFSNL